VAVLAVAAVSYNFLEYHLEDTEATLDVDEEALNKLRGADALVVTAERDGWKRTYRVYPHSTMCEAQEDFCRMRWWPITRILYQRDGNRWQEKAQKGPVWAVPAIRRLMEDFAAPFKQQGIAAVLEGLHSLFEHVKKRQDRDRETDL